MELANDIIFRIRLSYWEIWILFEKTLVSNVSNNTSITKAIEKNIKRFEEKSSLLFIQDNPTRKNHIHYLKSWATGDFILLSWILHMKNQHAKLTVRKLFNITPLTQIYKYLPRIWKFDTAIRLFQYKVVNMPYI